jgi:plastocyanin
VGDRRLGKEENPMRRLSYLVTLSVIALLMLAPAAGAQQSQGVVAVPVQAAWSVSIGDNFFDPADAAVEPGSTIMWINRGAVPHTVTADDGSFDSGILNPGDSFTVVFSGQGTLTYHCEIHPGMTGSVTVGGSVQPSAAGNQPVMNQPTMTGGY